MGIWEELRERASVVVEELGTPAGEPDARSIDQRVATVRSSTTEKHRLDRQTLERYWELYTNVPIVREPIRSFSGEVMEPGYYVDAENEELKEELEDWLEACAIISGESDQDFGELARKSIIQREVKGTCLIEKVYTEEDDDVIYGFKLMKPETVRAFTYPGQSVLLDPEDEELAEKAGDTKTRNFDARWSDYTLKLTDKREPAAYVQYDEELTSNIDRQYQIPFRRDDIIKMTRDEDVGEIFGTSRLAAAENRIESLLKKLDDNDKAIESLAHPFQLFQFGSEDDVWEPSKIDSFMNAHRDDDFEPGMKQGVQGDVSVETVSGEVAEIEEFLQFDINWIISEMPLPKYALGGFEENVNQFVSRSQETRIEKQISEARRELQDKFTSVLQDKAQELGYSKDDVNGLVIGEDPQDLGIQEVKDRMEEEEKNNTGESGTDFTRPPASSEDSRVEENTLSYFDDASVEELQAADVEISPDTPQEELSQIAENTLRFVRDRLIGKLEEHKRNKPERAIASLSSGYERIIEQETNRMFAGSGQNDFEELFESFTEETVSEVAELSEDGVVTNASDYELSRIYRKNFLDSVEQAAGEISRDVLQYTRRTLPQGGSIEEVKERILDKYTEEKLSNRAELISYMEKHDAEQTLHLSKYKDAEDIIGFRVVNDSDSKASICEELEGKEAYFDSEESIQEQLSSTVSQESTHTGFSPLPPTPPYHFRCDSEIEPIYEE